MCNLHKRVTKIAQEIKKKIALILQNKIQDPKIKNGLITVSGIQVSNDLFYAKIFVTFLKYNTPKHLKLGIQALKKASGFIQYLLSKYTYLRKLPKLIFIYDSSLIKGIKISNLIKNKNNKKFI